MFGAKHCNIVINAIIIHISAANTDVIQIQMSRWETIKQVYSADLFGTVETRSG